MNAEQMKRIREIILQGLQPLEAMIDDVEELKIKEYHKIMGKEESDYDDREFTD